MSIKVSGSQWFIVCPKNGTMEIRNGDKKTIKKALKRSAHYRIRRRYRSEESKNTSCSKGGHNLKSGRSEGVPLFFKKKKKKKKKKAKLE